MAGHIQEVQVPLQAHLRDVSEIKLNSQRGVFVERHGGDPPTNTDIVRHMRGHVPLGKSVKRESQHL
jgi:hypothetical protein